MKLLETISHAKPAKGRSHPLSCETLSSALEDIPQFNELKLQFESTISKSLGPMAGGRKIHGAHANDLQEYEGFFECEWDAEQGWRATVRCVPSARKATAASEFEATALPHVLEWLKSPRPESWFIGHYVLQVGISEFTDELALRIVHNDHVLEQKTLGN